MLWMKAFHIIFVISWYAGLLYLPRLFVYHCEASNQNEYQRFCVMEKKLFIIMTLGGIGAAILGLGMLHAYSKAYADYWIQAWLIIKLLSVSSLVIFHGYCWKLMRDFKNNRNHRSARWFRFYNEFPAIILMIIVIMVVVKPL